MQDEVSVKNGNSSFERVEQFSILGTTIMNESSVQEERAD
jgi:hypothetical protein